MAKPINRRIVLRGLGGAAVAAPFLGSLGGRRARAQTDAPPKRLIVMFTHYGCVTTRFFPVKSHGELSADDLDATTLEPLKPHVKKLLVPRGIRAMNEWTSTMSHGQGNDPHTQVVGSYFTCQPVTPNSDDPFSFDSATKFNAKPKGPSLDHVIAQQLSPRGTPLLISVGNRSDSPQSAISYSAAETPFPGLGLPSQVYSGLTGLFTEGEPLSPDSYKVLRGKSILDAVKDDLDTLERFDMSRSDRDKLEAWKTLLDETGTSVMGSAQCSSEIGTRLGATQALVDGVELDKGTVTAITNSVRGTAFDVADLYANVAVLAAVCYANPVIFLKYPSAYVFSELGINSDCHGLSHRTGNATMAGACVDGVLDLLQTIDGYYTKKFAHLVAQLDSIDEGDGKLLDNCAAVWFQEMSDGRAHNLNNLPIIQAGSAGGYFKTGFTVNVDDGSADLTRGYSDAYCTPGNDADADGISQRTGTPADQANAPINKYFVSLMNALGVRAGEDGFAAVNGQAEVTHFGAYDRTEDFIGGGTNPPLISDPGPFDALRA
jgi:hypothetical protein